MQYISRTAAAFMKSGHHESATIGLLDRVIGIDCGPIHCDEWTLT